MLACMTTGSPETAPGRVRGPLNGVHVLVVDDDAGPRQLFLTCSRWPALG